MVARRSVDAQFGQDGADSGQAAVAAALHDQAPAGTQHPSGLGEESDVVADPVQGSGGEHGVEGAVFKGESGLEVDLTQDDAVRVGCESDVGLVGHALRDIDRDHRG
ncbi:hypothetical protein OG928_34040 (plasmid) [Embleya sp. NBC_00896]|nr:hypothetical protein OG928_34040 [Embleya sp. NBC_00896]